MGTNNIKSYFGRGIKLNGVDQTINFPTFQDLGITTHSAFDFTITFQVDIVTQGIILNTGDDVKSNGFSLVIVGSTAAIKSNNNTPSLGTVTSGSWALTYTNKGTYTLYVNGNLIGSCDVPYDTPEDGLGFSSNEKITLGSNRGIDSFSSHTYGNAMFYRGVLTPEQIKYLYEYPEKFLYREDSVLKSKTDINTSSVISYLPMCETDGFIRDLVRYNEGEKNLDIGRVDVFAGWTRNGDDSFTNDGTMYNWLYFREILPSSGIAVFEVTITGKPTDKTTKIEIDTFNPTGISKKAILGIGTHKVILEGGDGRIYIKSYKGDAFTISDISVQQISGIYPIYKYTDSCRDNAKNLSTGLQTSKWKRDGFGVPYAFSDYLECDSSGYLDTGYIPSLDKDFTIEAVMEVRDNVPLSLHGNDYEGGVLFGSTSYSAGVFMRLFGISGTTYNRLPGLYHIVMTYNKKTKTVSMFLDKEELKKNIPIETSSAAQNTIVLGKGKDSTKATSYPVDTPLRLFKIYFKAITIQEVEHRYKQTIEDKLFGDYTSSSFLDLGKFELNDTKKEYVADGVELFNINNYESTGTSSEDNDNFVDIDYDTGIITMRYSDSPDKIKYVQRKEKSKNILIPGAAYVVDITIIKTNGGGIKSDDFGETKYVDGVQYFTAVGLNKGFNIYTADFVLDIEFKVNSIQKAIDGSVIPIKRYINNIGGA